MTKAIQNPKIIAGTVTFLLAITLVGLITFYEANKTLESGLNTEKLKSEKMLSEKLLLDKELVKLKQSIASLQGKNTDLDKMLNNASSKIAAKESELKKMQKENASMKNYKQQLAEVEKIKSDLESQLTSLTKSLDASNKEKESLNKMIASLQVKNKSLEDELTKVQIASLDDIRIEAFKKSKLTVSAKKTKKLDVNFIIPANTSSDNLQFKITDPSGKLLTAKDGTIVMVELEETPMLTASSDNTVYVKQTKQVKMEYKPKSKLKSGIYRIEILNDKNVYMGSLQVRLK
jgi:predicted  nucleic acid-binding Zn-ribbon protein